MSVSSLALPDVPKKSSNTSGNMANNGRVLNTTAGFIILSMKADCIE